MKDLTQQLFHLICVKDYRLSEYYEESQFERGFASAQVFFGRFDGKLDFKDKTVLDFGCGLGSNCIYMALHGAKRAVGIDIDEHRINFAKLKLAQDYQHLSEHIEFRFADNAGSEKFDLIISKDSFEHYSDPEGIVDTMKKYLSLGGIIAIGFGPLWKSPYGGHIDFMTAFPWAHLLFPESVIMRERRRFRPDESAESFEQIRGGLNKMTLRKYLCVIRKSGLEFEFLRINASDKRLVSVFNVLSQVPLCQEYFTINLYSIVRPSPSLS